ncbi:MAG: D-alanyl-D-alanine carboxypeptidase/D-alanyl-D-alanine-endopeptidase [Candidatus Nanopelagicales bacterium]|jgi:D-alanyl-D-alanine carboxypeptidase/D-alanyl-D-alanine-endopeptidase (penicillin-binding protein 4)|nr:D-alanyl-D-alanine carboxypeptidase/D-alanyl-D-alanine-endopeptidase [Candidatus Nanopelagicales bacterium]
MRVRRGAAGTALVAALALVAGPAPASRPVTDDGAPVAPAVLVPIVNGVAGGVAAPTTGPTAPPAGPTPTASAGPADPPTPPTASTSGGSAPAPDPGLGEPLDAAAVTATLGPLLRGGALGRGRTPARVVDVATGEVLFDQADAGTVPASTAKLVTAVSVLEALGPDARLTTRTVLQDRDAAAPRLVLVGGGDPSLTSTPGPVGLPGSRIDPASLAQLARLTRWTLAARGIERVRVGFDDSLFSGRALHPSWDPAFPAFGVVAPVSALQVDQGRARPQGVVRVADPAAEAAARFAQQLADLGLEVSGTPRRVVARPRAVEVQAVTSPPLGTLVERMLSTSDNDAAEALARVAALATGHRGSFAGVQARAAEVLAGLGIDDPASRVVDGSGLSRSSALRPADLTTLLAVAGDGPGALASGLPVAAATGSLRGRYEVGATRPGAGLVRGKTGTLTGVVGLAGYASRPDGRLLAFAVLDDSVPAGTLGGRRAIDEALAALVACDCTAS